MTRAGRRGHRLLLRFAIGQREDDRVPWGPDPAVDAREGHAGVATSGRSVTNANDEARAVVAGSVAPRRAPWRRRASSSRRCAHRRGRPEAGELQQRPALRRIDLEAADAVGDGLGDEAPPRQAHEVVVGRRQEIDVVAHELGAEQVEHRRPIVDVDHEVGRKNRVPDGVRVGRPRHDDRARAVGGDLDPHGRAEVALLARGRIDADDVVDLLGAAARERHEGRLDDVEAPEAVDRRGTGRGPALRERARHLIGDDPRLDGRAARTRVVHGRELLGQEAP